MLEQYSPGLHEFIDNLLDVNYFDELPMSKDDASGIRVGAITALLALALALALAKYVNTDGFRAQFRDIG